jgi:hypothetical protein
MPPVHTEISRRGHQWARETAGVANPVTLSTFYTAQVDLDHAVDVFRAWTTVG